MFPPTDNPAQRLLEILLQARPMPNRQIAEIWAAVFSITTMDAPTCYRILGHLNNLVDSVEIRIKQIDGINHDLYLRDLPTIREIVCPVSIRQHWHELKAPLDHGVLTGLEFCANELKKSNDEEKISKEEIASIREEFSQLFENVSRSSLSADLKLILYDLLTSALLSLDQYAILGNDGLKRTVAYTLGVLTLYKKEFLAARSNAIITRTIAAIKHLCDAVSVACKVKELGKNIQEMLQ